MPPPPTSSTTITEKTVPDVLDRLQDLLLDSESADEKKTDEEDEILALLTAVLDWTQNAYRRRELAAHHASTQLLVPALLQPSHSIAVLLLYPLNSTVVNMF